MFEFKRKILKNCNFLSREYVTDENVAYLSRSTISEIITILVAFIYLRILNPSSFQVTSCTRTTTIPALNWPVSTIWRTTTRHRADGINPLHFTDPLSSKNLRRSYTLTFKPMMNFMSTISSRRGMYHKISQRCERILFRIYRIEEIK